MFGISEFDTHFNKLIVTFDKYLAEVTKNHIDNSISREFNDLYQKTIDSIITVNEFDSFVEFMKKVNNSGLSILSVPYTMSLNALLSKYISDELRLSICNEAMRVIIGFITSFQSYTDTINIVFNQFKSQFKTFEIMINVLKYVIDINNEFTTAIITNIMSEITAKINTIKTSQEISHCNISLMTVFKDIKYRNYMIAIMKDIDNRLQVISPNEVPLKLNVQEHVENELQNDLGLDLNITDDEFINILL